MHDIVLALTGASGSIYAIRLLEVLLAVRRNVHLTISPAATQVLHHEVGLSVDLENFDVSQLVADGGSLDDSVIARLAGSDHAMSSVFEDSSDQRGKVIYHHHRDFSAGIASGSFLTAGMVICPCSMGTLGSLANGMCTNLIHRAAEVHLKERRKLVVVPRETPLSSIQLGNMQRLATAGAVVLPASPGFYHSPATMHDLVDFIVGRICDHLGVKQDLISRWGKTSGKD